MRLHVVTEQEAERIVHPVPNRPSSRRHSERSRISGGAKNLARIAKSNRKQK